MADTIKCLDLCAKAEIDRNTKNDITPAKNMDPSKCLAEITHMLKTKTHRPYSIVIKLQRLVY